MNTPGDQVGKPCSSLAIIGSGPSCLFLLKRLLDFPSSRIPKSITIFEKSAEAGSGMPYREETTDCHHLSNISSEEIPPLPESFAEWLGRANEEDLETWSIDRMSISSKAIYPRLALGGYFRSQYQAMIGRLQDAGIKIDERVQIAVSDLARGSEGSGICVTAEGGDIGIFDSVVIATGHQWAVDENRDDGFFASPWPIWKILPPRGSYYDFEIGILGASLSAFDVVTTLAHHHGEFQEQEQKLVYHLHPEAGGMRIILHAADGQLPHLLFEQTQPRRVIYRHTTREEIAGLVNDAGFLPMDRFFDEICRPVLIDGFKRDGRTDIAESLGSSAFSLSDLVSKLSSEHAYKDPFEGMAIELARAEELSAQNQPTHWKEYLDDLFYTLNFHAECLAAEDHLLLKEEILPFVMSVVAAMPLDSARKLLALREAGVIDLVAGKAEIDDQHSGAGVILVRVDNDGQVSEETFRMFVDCGGQDPSGVGRHPFPSLFADRLAMPARVRFRDPTKVSMVDDEKRLLAGNSGPKLDLGGLHYDRYYRLVGPNGSTVSSLFDLALPDINGLRPYSYGLQAADEAARICASMLVGNPVPYGIPEEDCVNLHAPT